MFFNRGDQAAVSLLTGVLCARRRGRVLIMFLTFCAWYVASFLWQKKFREAMN
jgi:hypothetical protein